MEDPPHGAQDRLGTRHRDRYLQLARVEPVGRPVGQARRGDAIPRLGTDRGRGPAPHRDHNRGPRCRFRGCAYDSLPRARRVCLTSRRCHQDRLCGRQCRCHRRRRSGNGHNTACGPCQYHNIRLWKAIYGPLAHAQTSPLARSLRRTPRGRNRRYIYHRCHLYGRPFEPRHKCRIRSLRSRNGIVRRNDGTPVPPRDGCGGTAGRRSRSGAFGAAAHSILCREDAGQDVSDAAAILEPLHVARTGRDRQQGIRHRPRVGTRHIGVDRLGGQPQVGRTRRPLDHHAHGYGPHGCDQRPRHARSHGTRDRQDEQPPCTHTLRRLHRRDSAPHTCRGPQDIQGRGTGQLRDRRPELHRRLHADVRVGLRILDAALPARILRLCRGGSGPQRPIPVGSAAAHSRPSGISICRRPA